jgi:hypothetical protein
MNATRHGYWSVAHRVSTIVGVRGEDICLFLINPVQLDICPDAFVQSVGTPHQRVSSHPRSERSHPPLNAMEKHSEWDSVTRPLMRAILKEVLAGWSRVRKTGWFN